MPNWDASYRLGVYDTQAKAEAARQDGLRLATGHRLLSLNFGTAESPGRGWIADVNGTKTDVDAFQKIWIS